MSANVNQVEQRSFTPESDPGTEERSNRASFWVAVIYVGVALATPLLVYEGPSVMTPTAPMIANEALAGHLSLRAHSL